MASAYVNEVQRLAIQERQRNDRARPYIGFSRLDSPTGKQEGSPIIGTDTIKGCRNGCFRCYANRISRFHRKVFAQPVMCFVLGIPDPDIVYRFGTFGDPATDWEWTFHEVDRLRAKGMRRFYFVTKLQSVKGFRDDPGLCLHVSFDLLSPRQLGVTMRNFDAIDAKRVIRLKSIRSRHRGLMAKQAKVVEFARARATPILETRFYTNVRADLRLLRMEGYEKKGGLFKYPGSVLEDCYGLKGHEVCDRTNSGKCLDCLNCLSFLA